MDPRYASGYAQFYPQNSFNPEPKPTKSKGQDSPTPLSVIPEDQVNGLIDELQETKDKEQFQSILNKFNEHFMSRFRSRHPYPIGKFPFGSAGPLPSSDNFQKKTDAKPKGSQSPLRNGYQSMYHPNPYPDVYYGHVDPYYGQSQNAPRQPSPVYPRNNDNYKSQYSDYQDKTMNSQFFENYGYGGYTNPQSTDFRQNRYVAAPNHYDFSQVSSHKEKHPNAFLEKSQFYQDEVKKSVDISNWTSIRREKEAELNRFS